MTKKVVKTAYNKLCVHAKKHAKLQKDFDEACREQYGFIFQDCNFSIRPYVSNIYLADESCIIDTLDYGTDSLPFNVFDEMMRKAMKIKNEVKQWK